MNANMNPAPPEGQDTTPPAARKTGPVGRTVNLGVEVGYVIIWGALTVVAIAVLAATGNLWALAALALFGWFLYRNIRNIVVHRGND